MAFGSRWHWLAVSLVPIWLFWSATPALLVREGWRGGRFLLKAGVAGAAVQGVLLPVGLRLAFPPMLSGWIGFGPIGVAMAIITWCGVIGISWVVIACVGAVLWERSAPAATVVAVEVEDKPRRRTRPRRRRSLDLIRGRADRRPVRTRRRPGRPLRLGADPDVPSLLQTTEGRSGAGTNRCPVRMRRRRPPPAPSPGRRSR